MIAYSPRVTADLLPDYSDMARFVAFPAWRDLPPAERAVAIWRYITGCETGLFPVQGIYEDPDPGPEYAFFDERDLVKVLNVHGHGYCGLLSPTLDGIYAHAGFVDSRIFNLRENHHCVTEVFYDDGWHYFDVDLGDELPVFHTDFGIVGLSLGSDLYFPEVYAVQYMQGAEILVWQHEPERFREHFQWIPLLKARALDSHAHFVAAMYADPRCYIANRYADGIQGAAWGRSMILNRVGAPVADTGHEDGAATAIIDLDRRKQDPYKPVYEAENIFFVNCLGDRTAFQPLAEPYEKPALPDFAKRRARIAVGHFWTRDIWRPDSVPETMLRVLDQAAESKPDLVLLSEMTARGGGQTLHQAADMVAEKARQMRAYVLIGGLDDTGKTSHAWLWNREGEIVFSEPIYWTKGFDEIKVFDADFARLGVHLCGDLYTFEVDRTLALKGAEIILDPSQMWGADGYNNELMLRARAIDNGCWMACAHWNSSDPGLRSLVVDPYGYVVAASPFQQEGVFCADIDFDQPKVYYAGRKAEQRQPGAEGISTYYTGDLPEQLPGWREMIFARRRPELYGILPAENEVTRRYRPAGGLE